MSLILSSYNSKDTERAISTILAYEHGYGPDFTAMVNNFYQKLIYLDHYGRARTDEKYFFGGDPTTDVELSLDGTYDECAKSGKWNFHVTWKIKEGDTVYMVGGLVQSGDPLNCDTFKDKDRDLSIRWNVHT